MVEKIGHIKNPLTVIAIFAGIAEISGTVVLPFLASENQFLYIWFLMLFPSILVLLFFGTLNFNRAALYSPSDYKDEGNFLKSMRGATPSEYLTKLKRETAEVKEDIEQAGSVQTSQLDSTEADEQEPKQASQPEAEVKPGGSNDASVHVAPAEEGAGNLENETKKGRPSMALRYKTRARNAGSHEILMSDVALAEALAIGKLSTDYGAVFKANITVEVPGANDITFDGLAMVNGVMHAAEVKLFTGYRIDVSRFYAPMIEVAYAWKVWSERHNIKFLYHIFIVGNHTPAQRSRAAGELKKFADGISLPVKVHFSSMNELENTDSLNPP